MLEEFKYIRVDYYRFLAIILNKKSLGDCNICNVHFSSDKENKMFTRKANIIISLENMHFCIHYHCTGKCL